LDLWRCNPELSVLLDLWFFHTRSPHYDREIFNTQHLLMKAYEFPAKLTVNGMLEVPPELRDSLSTDQPLRVIVLLEETNGSSENDDDDEMSVEDIKASLRQALHEARTGQTLPISQLWDNINAD
jgi:hypothetical protein